MTEKLTNYWNTRYLNGGNSGAGSYNEEASMKANFINYMINHLQIKSITETGCGDGNNLLLYNIPISYTGFDISPEAVKICIQKTRKIRNSLKYYFTNEYDKQDFEADLMLCLDVWYHQIEEEDFEALLKNLFVDFQGKYVCIYSTDTNSQFLEDGTPLAKHVKFREVQSAVQKFPNWELLYMIDGYRSQDDVNHRFPSSKKFYLYKRKS